MAANLAQKSSRYGTSAARRSLGMVAGNDRAVGALEKYGAGGLVRSAEGLVNKNKASRVNEDDPSVSNGAGKKAAPPPPEKKKGGVSGLVSGRVCLSYRRVTSSEQRVTLTLDRALVISMQAQKCRLLPACGKILRKVCTLNHSSYLLAPLINLLTSPSSSATQCQHSRRPGSYLQPSLAPTSSPPHRRIVFDGSNRSCG